MNEEAPKPKIDINTEKFKQALERKELMEGGRNKYESGSIRQFAQKQAESGEYEAYTEKMIEDTKAELDQLYASVDETKKASFKPNEEMQEKYKNSASL